MNVEVPSATSVKCLPPEDGLASLPIQISVKEPHSMLQLSVCARSRLSSVSWLLWYLSMELFSGALDRRELCFLLII